VSVCMCVFLYVCMYVYTCICVYVYTCICENVFMLMLKLNLQYFKGPTDVKN